MIALITLPAEIRFIRLASLTALKVAEIFSDSLNTKQSDEDFCHAFELSVSEAFTNSVRYACLLYTSPSPRDRQKSRMPSSA